MLLTVGASQSGRVRLWPQIAGEWIPASDLVLVPEWRSEVRSAAVGIGFVAQRQPLVAVLGIELAAALSSPLGLWACDACAYPVHAEQGAAKRSEAILSDMFEVARAREAVVAPASIQAADRCR